MAVSAFTMYFLNTFSFWDYINISLFGKNEIKNKMRLIYFEFCKGFFSESQLLK